MPLAAADLDLSAETDLVGTVRGLLQAAQKLHISRKTLYNKLREYGIE